jgi:hypothetical protein
MIPYDELVHALEDWRSRQGLGAPSTRVSQKAAPVAAQPAPYVPPPPQPNRGSGSYAAAAAPVAARPPLDDFEGDAGTEIRSGMDDEIDVDAEAVDVIDEQLEDE